MDQRNPDAARESLGEVFDLASLVSLLVFLSDRKADHNSARIEFEQRPLNFAQVSLDAFTPADGPHGVRGYT